MSETVGFVGLGTMGAPMARNLITAGFPLVVYDINPAKAEPFLQSGCSLAQSCEDLARRVEIVLSIVPDSPDAEAVYTGPSGVLEGARPKTILVDMSSISPVTAKSLAKEATKHQC